MPVPQISVTRRRSRPLVLKKRSSSACVKQTNNIPSIAAQAEHTGPETQRAFFMSLQSSHGLERPLATRAPQAPVLDALQECELFKYQEPFIFTVSHGSEEIEENKAAVKSSTSLNLTGRTRSRWSGRFCRVPGSPLLQEGLRIMWKPEGLL